MGRWRRGRVGTLHRVRRNALSQLVEQLVQHRATAGQEADDGETRIITELAERELAHLHRAEWWWRDALGATRRRAALLRRRKVAPPADKVVEDKGLIKVRGVALAQVEEVVELADARGRRLHRL